MARIVSTTSAGVPAGPDMTLDALMQRQKLLATQAGNRTANRQMISPWQGAAHLGEVLGDIVEQRGNDRELSDSRAEFAKLLAGVNQETGATQEQIAQAGLYDPRAAERLSDAAAQIVRDKRIRDQQLADRDAGWAHDDRLTGEERSYNQADQIADEKRALDAQIAQENRANRQPSSTLGKLKSDLDNGYMTEEAYNAAVAKEVALAKSQGMQMTFDDEGRVTGFVQGEGVVNNTAGANQAGKNLANAMEDYRTGAKAANELLPTIGNMEQAYGSAGYTGPGGTLYGWVDDALEAGSQAVLGKDVSLPGESGSRAIVKSGGLGFIMDAVAKSKGSISDAENRLFAAASPGLETTPGGASKLLGIAKGVAQRAIERDSRAQQWAQEKGSLVGFEQSWNDYINNNPLIVPDGQGGIMLATEAPPADAPMSPAAPAGAPAAAPQGGVARPQTDADFNALPPGTRFIDPDDGKEYVK